MLQIDEPDDFVIATGRSHSVREFCELAFAYAGHPISWSGTGADEKGLAPDGRVLIEIDPRYFRPTEVNVLQGDSTKAQTKIGWTPTIDFCTLVRSMVEADEALARGEERLADARVI